MRIDIHETSIEVQRSREAVTVTIRRGSQGREVKANIFLAPTHAMIVAAALKEYANDARKHK